MPPLEEPKANPLPVTATLQDLALLRASGVELASLLPAAARPNESNDAMDAVQHQEAIEQSNVFVGEMRKAIRIGLRGDVGKIKEDIDKLNEEVEKARRNVERIQDEQLEMLEPADE